MKKSKEDKKFTAYLGKGSNLTGNFNYDGVGRIDGNFKGEINSKDKLIVGETGSIEGNINVSELIVYGTINGNIDVKKATIHKTGKIIGDFKVKNLITESGAIIEGTISMQKQEDKNKIKDLKEFKEKIKKK